MAGRARGEGDAAGPSYKFHSKNKFRGGSPASSAAAAASSEARHAATIRFGSAFLLENGDGASRAALDHECLKRDAGGPMPYRFAWDRLAGGKLQGTGRVAL